MRRREFLITGAQAAASLGVLATAGCSHSQMKGASQRQSPRAPEAIGGQRPFSRLESLIPQLLAENNVAGLSIAVVRHGKLAWQGAFGFQDVEERTPVTADSVFEAASVSKTVFAYAVMKLSESRALDLDTPLSRYSDRRFLEGDARLDKITARHALSHTSGFADWRSNEHPLRIGFEPGERFRYSGEGYFYLQSVVTQLRGRVNPNECAQYEAGFEVCATDIDQWMRRSLLEPFGMHASGYVWRADYERRAARPHGENGKAGRKRRPRECDAARYASAGGLHTTAGDYAKFLLEIVSPQSGDRARLRAETLREMVRPQIRLSPTEKVDGADSWALGWGVQQRSSGEVLIHSGGQAGFRSLAVASQARQAGFIILTNSDNGGRVIGAPALVQILDPLVAG